MDEQHFEAIPPSAITQYARAHVFLVAAVRELTSVPSCKSRSGSCEQSTRLLGRKDMVALQTYNGDFADICSAGRIRVLQLCIASAKWKTV